MRDEELIKYLSKNLITESKRPSNPESPDPRVVFGGPPRDKPDPRVVLGPPPKPDNPNKPIILPIPNIEDKTKKGKYGNVRYPTKPNTKDNLGETSNYKEYFKQQLIEDLIVEVLTPAEHYQSILSRTGDPLQAAEAAKRRAERLEAIRIVSDGGKGKRETKAREIGRRAGLDFRLGAQSRGTQEIPIPGAEHNPIIQLGGRTTPSGPNAEIYASGAEIGPFTGRDTDDPSNPFPLKGGLLPNYPREQRHILDARIAQGKAKYREQTMSPEALSKLHQEIVGMARGLNIPFEPDETVPTTGLKAAGSADPSGSESNQLPDLTSFIRKRLR